MSAYPLTMDDLSLWGLFFSAFISATLFPGGSEVVLGALVHAGGDPWTLLGIATLGNTLGGMSTWWLGWLLARRYPPKHLHRFGREQAVERLKKWGSPVLLFSWLPVVGDPLCFAAGWLKINPGLSALFMGIGKASRYIIILFVV